VRQIPDSAKGVLFVTIKEEADVANLVIWRKLYVRQSRVICGAILPRWLALPRRRGHFCCRTGTGP
jgi:hypothetical protein